MKKLRKSKSSPLQLPLPFDKSSQVEIDIAKKFEKLDELDLMEIIHEIKSRGLPEDEAYLSAAQHELEQRQASQS